MLSIQFQANTHPILQNCKTPKEIEWTRNRRHLSQKKRSSPTPPILVGQQQPFHVLQPQFRRHNERLRIHILQTQSNKTLPNSDGSETLKGQNKRGKLIRKEHNRQSFHFKRRAVQHPRHHNNPRQKKSQETEHAQTPSLFFPRVRTPCGRCAQVIIEGWETQHIDGGSKTQNQHQNSQQQPQNPNPKQTKTKATTKDPQSMSVVFLCGCETGEKMSCKISKGLNSPRKAKCI